ncbi:MAG: class I SAM-dependent methyltransferase [Planctomycetota bacterium]|nr:class I SAM-dependent methyltransferase [Planctomycetota bacterium]
MKGRESGMPEEAAWSSYFDPGCVLDRLGCDGACRDAFEFGCGYGTFSVPAASRIAGALYTQDIEPEMVAATAQKAQGAGLSNVLAEVRDFMSGGTGRPDASVDYAMLFNLLHVEGPVELLREARRILAPGGRLGVIHWRADVETPRGPPLGIRPTPEQVREWGEAAGLRFERFEALPCCSWHWGLVLRRDAH